MIRSGSFDDATSVFDNTVNYNAHKTMWNALTLGRTLFAQSLAQKWDVCENLSVAPDQIGSIFRRMYPDMHVSCNAITHALLHFVFQLSYCVGPHLIRK